MEAWSQFFIRAGIPKEISFKYAKSFQNNRITKEMLPDLDKSTLAELGVSAIGDQLLILRRINAAKIGMNFEEDQVVADKVPKIQIKAPEESSISYASEIRRGKPPPDRHEIYHVKMPVGNTARTQRIMEKARKMRMQGLVVRGTTGVRQGGRSVSPVDKTSLAARLVKKQSSEVSSSTDRSGHQRGGPRRIPRITTSSRIQKQSPGISIQFRSDEKPRRSRLNDRIQIRTDEDDEYLEVDDQGMEVEVDYDDQELEYVEDVYEEEEPVKSIHQRIKYVGTRNQKNHNRRATVMDQESVFSRVSYYK